MVCDAETVSISVAAKLSSVYDAEQNQGVLFDAAEAFPESDFAFNAGRLRRLIAQRPGMIVMPHDTLQEWQYAAQRIGAGFKLKDVVEQPNSLWTNVLNAWATESAEVEYFYSHGAYVMSKAGFDNVLRRNYLEAHDDRANGMEWIGVYEDDAVADIPDDFDDDDASFDAYQEERWWSSDTTDDDYFDDDPLTDTIDEEQGEES